MCNLHDSECISFCTCRLINRQAKLGRNYAITQSQREEKKVGGTFPSLFFKMAAVVLNRTLPPLSTVERFGGWNFLEKREGGSKKRCAPPSFQQNHEATSVVGRNRWQEGQPF